MSLKANEPLKAEGSLKANGSLKAKGAITGVGDTRYSKSSGKSVTTLQMASSLFGVGDLTAAT